MNLPSLHAVRPPARATLQARLTGAGRLAGRLTPWLTLSLALSCGTALNATEVGLRNCVEQEATAAGRQACLQRVPPPEGEASTCAEGRTYGARTEYETIDDDRLEDLQKDVKYLRHDAWEAVANAPFLYDVDWGSSRVEDTGDNATEWLRGALLGQSAKLSLGASPEIRGLIDMSVHRDGTLLDEFVQQAPASALRTAADGLAKVAERLGALRRNVHEVFSGLYLGLERIHGTTACYRDFAQAERRLQQSIAAFRTTIDASRKSLEARFTVESAQEAQDMAEDRAAWKSVNVASCKAPKKATDCDGVDDYLDRFPQGGHAEQARKILASVASTLGPLRDEADWKNARVKDCQRPKKSDGCDGVKAYVAAHPDGSHAGEAKRLLRLRRGALARLTALEAQRRRIAAQRAQQACVQECAASLRSCQRACRKGDPSSWVPCQRTCLKTFRESCVPACKN